MLKRASLVGNPGGQSGAMPEGVREACETDARRLAEIDAFAESGARGARPCFATVLPRDSVGSRSMPADGSAASWYFKRYSTSARSSASRSNLASSDAVSAARLLSAALEEARAQGARTCYLEVRVSNEAAQSLYLAHGFVPNGLRKAYYGAGAAREDALLLRLEMAAREP